MTQRRRAKGANTCRVGRNSWLWVMAPLQEQVMRRPPSDGSSRIAAEFSARYLHCPIDLWVQVLCSLPLGHLRYWTEIVRLPSFKSILSRLPFLI